MFRTIHLLATILQDDRTSSAGPSPFKKKKEKQKWRKRYRLSYENSIWRETVVLPRWEYAANTNESPKILSALHNWWYNFHRAAQPLVKYSASFVTAGSVRCLWWICTEIGAAMSFEGFPGVVLRPASLWCTRCVAANTEKSYQVAIGEARFVNVKPSIPSNTASTPVSPFLEEIIVSFPDRAAPIRIISSSWYVRFISIHGKFVRRATLDRGIVSPLLEEIIISLNVPRSLTRIIPSRSALEFSSWKIHSLILLNNTPDRFILLGRYYHLVSSEPRLLIRITPSNDGVIFALKNSFWC